MGELQTVSSRLGSIGQPLIGMPAAGTANSVAIVRRMRHHSLIASQIQNRYHNRFQRRPFNGLIYARTKFMQFLSRSITQQTNVHTVPSNVQVALTLRLHSIQNLIRGTSAHATRNVRDGSRWASVPPVPKSSADVRDIFRFVSTQISRDSGEPVPVPVPSRGSGADTTTLQQEQTRVDLQQLVWDTRGGGSPEQNAAPPTGSIRIFERVVEKMHHRENQTQSLAMQILHHHQHRGRNTVEANGNGYGTMVPALSHSYRAVPMQVRRSTPRLSGESHPSVQEEARQQRNEPPKRRPTETRRARTMQQLDQLDLNQLTNHIIRSIDGKIIAQRERMGKI